MTFSRTARTTQMKRNVLLSILLTIVYWKLETKLVGLLKTQKTVSTGLLAQVKIIPKIVRKQIYFNVSEETTGQNIGRAGKYLWIEKSGEDFETSIARISSPTYRNSRSDCTIRFWYYIAGDLGAYFIKPAIHPDGAEKDIMLDFMAMTEDWKIKTITIGRRRGAFQVIFYKTVIFETLYSSWSLRRLQAKFLLQALPLMI